MVVLKQLNTATDFWVEMVVPDCNNFFADEASLRRALHAAISLFHMSDWVFKTHEASVRSAFAFNDKKGNVRPTSKASEFATALEQQNPDFGRIRGIAHAAKHLVLTDIRPVLNAPRHAANTAVQTTGYRQGGYGQGPFGGGARVMLAGANGDDMEFSNILRSVYKMWESLKSTHGW